jgi:hypothetical protein
MEKYSIKNLNEMNIREECQLKISNRLVDLENQRAWENIVENMNISAEGIVCQYPQKQHRPLFGEDSSKFVDHRNQDKISVATGSKQRH